MKEQKKPDDAWLLELKEHMTCTQIARAYQVKPHTVENWLCDARKKCAPKFAHEESLKLLHFSDFFGAESER